MTKMRRIDEARRGGHGARGNGYGSVDLSTLPRDGNGDGLATMGLGALPPAVDGHAVVLRFPEFRERDQPAATMLIASPTAGLRREWRQAMNGLLAIHEVSDCVSLERSLGGRHSGVLLLDLKLPGLDGIGDVARIRRLQSSIRTMVLTSRPDDREGVAALKAGAWGYSERDIAPGLLKKAVDVIRGGEIWIGRKMVPVLLEELRTLSERPPSALTGTAAALELVSAREREIAQLVSAGGNNREIATKLGITERTVKAHLTAIFRKLGISGRLQLALLMLEQS
jgi:two-component system, NarL family, nitrate/nitrite response regulator NarL